MKSSLEMMIYMNSGMKEGWYVRSVQLFDRILLILCFKLIDRGRSLEIKLKYRPIQRNKRKIMIKRKKGKRQKDQGKKRKKEKEISKKFPIRYKIELKRDKQKEE